MNPKYCGQLCGMVRSHAPWMGQKGLKGLGLLCPTCCSGPQPEGTRSQKEREFQSASSKQAVGP